MLGGVLTLCPDCSNQWTLSPAVSASWFCPKCGGATDDNASNMACNCTHLYSQHHTAQNVPPSRAAFAITLNEIDKLDSILATKPEPAPRIGKCEVCDCTRFRLRPPHLDATQFLERVKLQANRSARSRNIIVTTLDDSVVLLTLGSHVVKIRLKSNNLIVLEELNSSAAQREFKMGRSTVGKCVLAVLKALRC